MCGHSDTEVSAGSGGSCFFICDSISEKFLLLHRPFPLMSFRSSWHLTEVGKNGSYRHYLSSVESCEGGHDDGRRGNGEPLPGDGGARQLVQIFMVLFLLLLSLTRAQVEALVRSLKQLRNRLETLLQSNMYDSLVFEKNVWC